MVARVARESTGGESNLASTTDDVAERFRALVERYERLLRSALRRTTSPDSGLQLDDIEQEARIRIWKALQRGEGIRSPASYLYRVAVNTTLDAMRRVRARREEAARDRSPPRLPSCLSAKPLVRSLSPRRAPGEA
jgi:RNA polymerase sigma factor (sigma-70 family)